MVPKAVERSRKTQVVEILLSILEEVLSIKLKVATLVWVTFTKAMLKTVKNWKNFKTIDETVVHKAIKYFGDRK